MPPLLEQHTGRGGREELRENSCVPKQKEPVGNSSPVHINSAFKTPCVPRAEQYNTSVCYLAV